jgi:hypothetical protein
MDYTSWQVMSDTAEHKSERQTVLKHGNRKQVPNIKTDTKQPKLLNHIPGTGHSYIKTEQSADTLQTIPKQNAPVASNEGILHQKFVFGALWGRQR